MSYFICIIADHSQDSGEKVKGRDIYLRLMSKKVWGLHPTVVLRAKLKKGDSLLFYLGKSYEFLGSAKVAKEPYKVDPDESKDLFIKSDTLKIDLSNVEIWDKQKPIKPLLGELSFIKNSINWGAYLQGGIRKIVESDYKLIINSTDYRTDVNDLDTSLANFLNDVDFTATQFEPHSLDSPERIKVCKIIENIERNWVIPNFQRYFDWNKEDIRSFIESIFNDYYVGAFLLWESNDESPLAVIPIQGVDETNKNIEYIILDGQQRMTALYYAIRSPNYPPKGGKRCYYYIDFKNYLEKRDSEGAVTVEMEPIGAEQEFEKLLFPVNKLESYDKWINDLEDYLINTQSTIDPEKIRNLRRTIEKRLRHIWNGFEIPYVVLPRTMTLNQVADIFEKINTKGKLLSVFDLLIARLLRYDIELRKLWEKADSQNLYLQRYAKKSDKIKIYIFQTISLLYHPANSTKKSDLLNIFENLSLTNNTEFYDLWELGVSAIDKALQMLENLRDGFGVRNENDIPFLPMIPVLAALLNVAESRENKAICYGKIKQWYWSAVFTNAYSSGAESQMTADFKDVTLWFDDDTNLPRVIRAARKNIDGLDLIEIKQTSNSLYRGTLSLLAIKGSEDFESGQKLENSRKNEKDHIFARSIRGGFGDNPNIDSVVNMTWLSKETNVRKSMKKPSVYIPEFIKVKYGGDKDKFRSVLESHYINDEVYVHLSNDNFAEFLKARGDSLRKEIKREVGEQSLLEDQMEESPEKIVDTLENKVREFLDAHLKESYGEDYWENVSPGVRQRVAEKLKQRYKRHPGTKTSITGIERLSFCDVMDYSEIILKSWIIFEEAFGSKSEVEKHFLNLKEYRDALKHNRVMNNVEKKQGEASFEWIYLIADS